MHRALPTLIATAVALVFTALWGASTASAAKVLMAPAQLPAGSTASLRIDAGGTARACSLSARSRAVRTKTFTYAITRPILAVSWRIPRRARTATWRVRITCAKSKQALSRSKSLSIRLRVDGTRRGRRALFVTRSVKVVDRARNDLRSAAPEPDVSGSEGGKGGLCASSDNGFRSVIDGSSYCTGYCTWFVYQRRPEAGLRQLGNAATWYERTTLPKGRTPAVGAVAWWAGTVRNPEGHVALVTAVSGDTVTVEEMNVAGWNVRGTRVLPRDGRKPDGYIYGGTAGSGGGTGGGSGASGGPFQMAFQANTGSLITFGSAGNADTGQGMMPGTNPSIARLAGGGHQMAFQANTGELIVYGDSQKANTGQGMMAGTSPSIAASPQGGFRVAFQANNGRLYTYDSATGPAATDQGMRAGTSPAITALPTQAYGYQMAFQANTGDLIAYGDSQKVNTGQGMSDGTSPSIAASPQGGFRVAFQANTGALYTYDSATGPAATDQGMRAGTSPAITALPTQAHGYQMAFQANTGDLIVYGDTRKAGTGQGMRAGTSPSIAASPQGGFRVAFQANTGALYTFDSGSGPAATDQGMKEGTSPAIAP